MKENDRARLLKQRLKPGSRPRTERFCFEGMDSWPWKSYPTLGEWEAGWEWRPWSTVWNRHSGPWDWYAPEPEWNSTRWYGTRGTQWKVKDAMESQPAPLERPRTMQPSSSSSRGATQPMDAHGASQPVEPTTQDRVQKSNEFASFSTAPAERLPRTTAWKRIVWRMFQAMPKDTHFCERAQSRRQTFPSASEMREE